MSTTKQFINIKSGKRHQIDATARGYYDFRTTVIPQPNKPLSYDMKVYDGLKYDVDLSKNSVRPGEINFDGTVLPYVENNTLTKTNYCFGNSGTNYDLPVYEEIYSNITKVGNVNIDDNIASNFSSSDYIVITKSSENMTIYLKVTTGSDISTSQVVINLERFFDLQVYNNVFGCYDWGAVAYYTLLSDITTNTTYFWKIELSGSDKTKKYSYSTDGTTYTEVKTFVDSGISYSSDYELCLGIHSSGKHLPFNGSIDLSKSTVSEKQTNGDFVDYKLNAITFNPTGTYESKIGIFQDYEDNGQSNTLNCFSNSNRYTVLSPNENIIYYMKHQYIDWTQPILSSDGTMGGDLFAVNSSSILRAGREAYKAFDGDTSTIDDNWHSSQGHPSWIEWYNPNPLKITRIKIQNRNSADGGSFINTYKLSYSDDYSNWVDLLSGTSPSQENFTYWNIDITEENPHKYWRLTCLTSSGSNSDYTSIQTISITAQEYVSLKGTPDDYDEIVKYTYLGTVDIPKHNIYNVDNFYGWSNDSKSIFTKTLQLSTDIPLYNSSYKQESAITISSFADNSITLSNNEVYTRNNTLDKHVVLSTSASGGEVNPPNPDIPTTLKFGDRIDNKATVVGTFESSDLGTVAFAVLDAQYRNPSVEWVQSNIVNSLTDMPLYTIDEALAAKESATHNTDYVISVGGEGAFSYCRSIDPLNYNGKTYNCQLPNAYELNEIYNNRESLDTFDTTVSANETKKLSNWGFGNPYQEVLSSSRDKQFGYGFHLNYRDGNQVFWRGNPGRLGVCPIIEIPLSK